jgi:hypothetical protein
MAEELVVLGEPLVGEVPVERDVAAEERRGLDRLAVGPRGIRHLAVADSDRPVRRLTLVPAVRPLLARLEEVEANLLVREVIDGQVPRLVQQPRVAAVDDGLAADDRADSLRHRPPEEHRPGRRLDGEVQVPGRILREGPSPGRERHLALLQQIPSGRPGTPQVFGPQGSLLI